MIIEKIVCPHCSSILDVSVANSLQIRMLYRSVFHAPHRENNIKCPQCRNDIYIEYEDRTEHERNHDLSTEL
jgi:DNA-directed RNA polymerase subunit RPC12/RpoP